MGHAPQIGEKMKKIILAVMVSCSLMAIQAEAFEVTGTGVVSAQTQYVFRGVEQTTNPTYSAGFDLETAFVEVGAWAATLQDQKQFEVDTYVGLRTDVGAGEVRVGIISYNYYGANMNTSQTAEYYAGVGYDVAGIVDADVVGYYGVQTKDIWYEATVGKTYDDLQYIPVGENFSWKLGTSFGQYKNAKNAFENVFVNASFDVYKGVGLNVDYTQALGDKIINGVAATNTISGGISYNF